VQTLVVFSPPPPNSLPSPKPGNAMSPWYIPLKAPRFLSSPPLFRSPLALYVWRRTSDAKAVETTSPHYLRPVSLFLLTSLSRSATLSNTLLIYLGIHYGLPSALLFSFRKVGIPDPNRALIKMETYDPFPSPVKWPTETLFSKDGLCPFSPPLVLPFSLLRL